MVEFVPFDNQLKSKEDEEDTIEFVPFGKPLPVEEPTVQEPLQQEDYVKEQNTTPVTDLDAPTQEQMSKVF